MLDWCDTSAVIFHGLAWIKNAFSYFMKQFILVILLSIIYCNDLYVLQSKAVLQGENQRVLSFSLAFKY